MRIAVVGAGSWGTALSVLAARAGHEVSLWTRDASHALDINRERRNTRHLVAHPLPVTISVTADLEEALDKATIIVLALPSHATREVVRLLSPALPSMPIVVGATKGIEVDSLKRISEIVAEELLPACYEGFVALSGPSFAEEVAADQPTAVVAASLNAEACEAVQRAFSYGNFRIYTNTDLAGVELCGAAKNTFALAAGMCAGLGLGSNSVAALITRGLAEMTRLAVGYGAQAETLMGLAGLGDLVLTCTGRLSRNRHVGEELGRGKRLDDVLGAMNEVAEGVRTTVAISKLAAEKKIDMPITEEVFRVLYENKPVADAIGELMKRPLKEEFAAEARNANP